MSLRPDPGQYLTLRDGDQAKLERYVTLCAQAHYYGFDTETTGLDSRGWDRDTGDVTVGYCLSHQVGMGVYIPFGHASSDLTGLVPGQMPMEDVFRIVGPLLAGRHPEQRCDPPKGIAPRGLMITHSEFEYQMTEKDFGHLDEGGHIVPHHDTLIAAKVISWATGRWDPKGEGGGLNLKNLTRQLCGWEVMEIEDLFPDPPLALNKNGTPKKKQPKKRIEFHRLDPFDPAVARYAAADASNTLAIFPRLMLLVNEHGLGNTYNLERQLAIPVYDMKSRGVLIDSEYSLAKHREGLAAAAQLREDYLRELGSVLGREIKDVNLDSPPQMAELFFEDPPKGLGLPVLKRSEKTKKPSTDRKVVERLAKEFPLVRRLLTYRGITKQLGTYLKALPEHVVPATGRVHAGFSPLGTETGRFSCSDPNLQNQPREGMRFDITNEYVYVAHVRDVIICPPGTYLLEGDYSQVEYRAMAGEAGETSLIEAFIRGEDVHQKTAALIFHRDYAAVTPHERQRGKQQNFSLLFGQSPASTAEVLGITVPEAEDLNRSYFDNLPAIKAWLERTHYESRRRGYGMTKFGRRAHLPEFDSSVESVRKAGDRQAVSVAIQGTCAEIIKMAMIRFRRMALERGLYHRVRMILTVHDSLAFEVDEDVPIEEAVALIDDAMILTIAGWPPLAVDYKAGYRYGSLKKYVPGEPFEFPSREHIAAVPPPVPDGGSGAPGGVDPGDGDTSVPLEPVPLSIVVPELTVTQYLALRDLIATRPGHSPVELTIGSEPVPVRLPGTTSLGPEANEWVMACSPFRPRISWKTEPSPADNLFAGMA